MLQSVLYNTSTSQLAGTSIIECNPIISRFINFVQPSLLLVIIQRDSELLWRAELQPFASLYLQQGMRKCCNTETRVRQTIESAWHKFVGKEFLIKGSVCEFLRGARCLVFMRTSLLPYKNS